MSTEYPGSSAPNEDAVSFIKEHASAGGVQEQTNSGFREFLRYNAWRYAANAEWLGGIAANIALTEAPNPARWATAGLVGISVAFLENKQTDYAARVMDESYRARNEKPAHAPTLARELFAFGASIHQGSGASVEINDALGLPNTLRRRRVQAYAYAGAVAIWASPPVNELGQEALNQVVDHPVRTALVTLAGSIVGKFAIVDGIKKLRKRLEIR